MISPMKMKHLQATLLVVEDDKLACENIKSYCDDFFTRVLTSYDGLEAWDIYQKESPDIILTDIQLPGIDGLKLASKIREVDESSLIFVITAFSQEEYFMKAIPLKLENFIFKPLSSAKMDTFLNRCYKRLNVQNDFVSYKQKWTYSYSKKHIIHQEQIIMLTHLEITIFEVLLKNKNNYIHYESIIDKTKDSDKFSISSLRTLVSRIRKKAPFLEISSRQNIGYCLHVES